MRWMRCQRQCDKNTGLEEDESSTLSKVTSVLSEISGRCKKVLIDSYKGIHTIVAVIF